MLILLRLLFGAGLGYVAYLVTQNALHDPASGDMANAGYLALAVLLGIANAVVWAPFIGGKMADTLTGSMLNSTYYERRNYLLRFIYFLQGRGWSRLAALFCFFEGIHHPELPTAFVIGMKNARPGSRLQKIYAKEVFRFDNIQNCVAAFQVLQRFGIDPRPHRNPQVQLSLETLDRQERPAPEVLAVPKAETPSMKRNPHIQLFEKPEPPPKPKDKPA